MATNQEQIEARLCDYIEGTVTEAERADIEKHLAANPQHRRLIDQLLKTRHLIRQLPRAKAPADVSETLQGQLERSILLGANPEEHQASSLRIGAWSRWGTLAAAACLMIALAGTIYLVLRNPRQSFEIAVMTKPELWTVPSTMPLDTETPIAIASAKPAETNLSAGEAAAKKVEPEAHGGAVSNAFANDKLGMGASGGAEPVADAIFGASSRSRRFAAPAFEAVCVADPSVSSTQVTKYLNDNNLQWTVEPMPGPLPLKENQLSMSRATQVSGNFEVRNIEPMRSNRKESTGLFAPATQPTTMPAGTIDVPGIANARTSPQATAGTTMLVQQNVIRARNLTRRQEVDLRANLSKAQTNKELDADRAPAATTLNDKDAVIDESKAEAPEKAPATAPSQDQFGMATTLPTTEPADQRIDVLIVLNGATTQPSTQPATEPTEPATESVPTEK